jgi:hypothetical protein
MLKNYRSEDQGNISLSRRLETAVLEDLRQRSHGKLAEEWHAVIRARLGGCLPFLDLRRSEEAFLAFFATAEPPP